MIPAGTPYSDRLRLWTDEPGHWLWEPAQGVLLSDFKDDEAKMFARKGSAATIILSAKARRLVEGITRR
jgi:hypothetical protein